MPLNSTPEEINAQADFDFREKLRLERTFQKELTTIFNRMAIDLRATLKRGDSFLDAAQYRDRFRRSLEKQARRVTRSFTGQVLDFLDSESDNLEEPVINDLNTIAESQGQSLLELLARLRRDTRTQVQAFNSIQSAADSLFVTATNQTRLDSIIAGARAEFDNVDDIARAAFTKFKSEIPGRVNNIAATFTQKVAENTKNTERQNFFQERNGFSALEAGLPQIEEEEFWVTRGDNVVRPAHLEADFTLKEGVAFNVGGEQLRFPGDVSLGASAKNVNNCRCSAVISIE